MEQLLREAFERIKAKCQVDERGCWNWQGALSKDMYGAIRVGDKVQRTHRVTYAVVNGWIPRGKVVRHKCDNALCCNPDHLEIGDHEDNTQDAIDRNRHARRVLTSDEKTKVVSMRRAGSSKREIAVALKCNWYAVSRAIDELMTDVKRPGRPRGSRNAVTRVSTEEKEQIRSIYAEGKHTQKQLAERFGCDQTYVSLIVRGKA